MALVNCPECKKEVSETANLCPNCGFKISDKGSVKVAKKVVRESAKGFVQGGMVGAVLGIIFLLYLVFSK